MKKFFCVLSIFLILFSSHVLAKEKRIPFDYASFKSDPDAFVDQPATIEGLVFAVSSASDTASSIFICCDGKYEDIVYFVLPNSMIPPSGICFYDRLSVTGTIASVRDASLPGSTFPILSPASVVNFGCREDIRAFQNAAGVYLSPDGKLSRSGVPADRLAISAPADLRSSSPKRLKGPKDQPSAAFKLDSYLEYWIKKTLDDDFIRIEYIEESDCLEIVGDAKHITHAEDGDEEIYFSLLVHDILELCRDSLDEGLLDVSAVNIRLLGGLVDQYGNPLDDVTSFAASFTADTIKKINFDGLPLNRFKPLATNWIVHPAFR